MKLNLFSWLVLLGGGITLAGTGPEPGPDPAAGESQELSPAYLNQLADSLRTNLPALRAAEARLEAARAGTAAVRVWEEPRLRLGVMASETSMRAEDGDVLLGIEQPIPLPGRPAAVRRLAARESDVAAAAFEALFQVRRRDLVQALFELALRQREVEVGEEDLAWLAGMVQSVTARYRVGDAPHAYLLRLENEHDRRAAALTSAQARVTEAEAAVNRLLGRPVEQRWPRLVLPPLAPEVAYRERLITRVLAYEPNLRRLQAEVRAAAAAEDVARRRRWPELAVGAETRHYSGDGEFRQAMFTVSLNLPWLNAGRYRQDVRRETARRTAAEAEQADYDLAVREEVRRLTAGLEAQRRTALALRDHILPRAELALDSTRAAWETGRVQFQDVIEARRAVLEARLDLTRAVAAQYQLLADLALCCGLGNFEALWLLDWETSPPAPPTP